MKIYRGNIQAGTSQSPSSLVLGFFDGLHLGHLALIKKAKEQRLRTAMFSFEAHPDLIFNQANFPGYLYSLEQRLAIFEEAGIDDLYLAPLSKEVLDLSPLEFYKKWICQYMKASCIIVGNDFNFGKKGAGRIEDLKTWSGELGQKTIVIEDLYYQGEVISSKLIREAVMRSDFAYVHKVLGRPYNICYSQERDQDLVPLESALYLARFQGQDFELKIDDSQLFAQCKQLKYGDYIDIIAKLED